MAAAVLSNRTANWGSPKIIVDSSGTSTWHVGQGAHPTSQKTWEKAGYKYSHSARHLKSSDFFEADLILVMGAAQFDGRPSDILRQRLEQALSTYKLGLAPVIYTVGAGAPGDRTTEAAASRNC